MKTNGVKKVHSKLAVSITLCLVQLFTLSSAKAQFTKDQMHLYKAIFTNNIEYLDSVNRAGALNPNQIYDAGVPLLHLACMEGRNEVVGFLISIGADVNLSDKQEITPVKAATLRGNLETLHILNDNNVSFLQKDKNGETLLCYLLKYGQSNQKKIADFIIEKGIDLNATDELGKTALVYAIEKRFQDIGIKLIENGANIKWIEKQTGKNLLHYCAIFGTPEIASKLIDKGIDIQEVDNSKRYPLIYALKHGHKEMLHLLKAGEKDQEIINEILAKTPFEDNMEPGQSIVWNLNHRGWAIQTHTKLLVFDYEEMGNPPEQPSILNGWLKLEEIKSQSIISLYSCWHGDANEGSPMHNMDGKIEHIQYILNNDDAYKGKESYHKMKAGEAISVDNLKIESFRSDEISLGYFLKGDGLRVLYTGFPDANNMAKNLNSIQSELKGIDILFVSVVGFSPDSKESKLCLDYLISQTNPAYIVPVYDRNNGKQRIAVKNWMEKHYPQINCFLPKFPGERICTAH